MAINVRNNYEAANTCAKKDWKKFLANVASTCGITIDYNSRTNPTVSAIGFPFIISIQLIQTFFFFHRTEQIQRGQTA